MKLFSRNKPKIKVQVTKREGFNDWLKCTHCKELTHANEVEAKNNCCPKCDYHYRLPAQKRIQQLSDEGSFKELFDNIKPVDCLNFKDTESYTNRIARTQKKTGRVEGVIVGTATLDSHPIALGVLDFSYMGGSMGSVVGEKLTLLIELALKESIPLVIVSASGGARMQESVLSLMQMAKTSVALAKLHENNLLFISILTNPTSGGVTASFASLGDVIIAEPDALICFAGPRVIEQTIGEKLPDKAQKSEFLLEHGMIDCVVKRHNIRKMLINFIDFFSGNQREFFHFKVKDIISSKEEKGKNIREQLTKKLHKLVSFSSEDGFVEEKKIN